MATDNNEFIYPDELPTINLEDEKTKNEVIKKSEELKNLISTNQYEKIDAKEISLLYDVIDSLLDEKIREELKSRVDRIKLILIDGKNEIDNNKLNIVYNELDEISRVIKNTFVIRKSQEQSRKNKINLYLAQEQHKHDYYRDKQESEEKERIQFYIDFLSELKNRWDERVCSDEALKEMTPEEMKDLVDIYTTLMSDKEFDEIMMRIAAKAEKRTKQNDNANKEKNNEGIDEPKKTDLDDIINLIKKTSSETPAEEIDKIVIKIAKYILETYKDELDKNIKNILSSETVEAKIDAVEHLINYIMDNIKNITDNNDELIWKSFAIITDQLNKNEELINDYFWFNADALLNARKLIKAEENYEDFMILMENLEILLENPIEEAYAKWQEDIREYFANSSLDPEDVLVYINAYAKMHNESLKIDKDFNIIGLNIEKTNDIEELDDILEKIKALLATIGPNTPSDVKEVVAKEVAKYVIVANKKRLETLTFEFKNSETIDEKIEIGSSIIKLCQDTIPSYDTLDDEMKKLLDEQFIEQINVIYNINDYCFNQLIEVRKGQEIVNNEPALKTLVENMDEIIKNPTEEDYVKWQEDIRSFFEHSSINRIDILPYLIARAKMINPELDITVEFEITGLEFEQDKVIVTDLLDQIKELLASIGPDSTLEEKKEVAEKVAELVIKINEKELEKLTNEYYNSKNIDEKIKAAINIIKLCQNTIPSYETLEDEMKQLIEEAYKKQLIKNYGLGDYCFVNLNDVVKGQEIVNNNPELKVLIENVKKVLDDPTLENLNEWKQELINYISKNNIDKMAILPYMNAYIKLFDNRLSIDENFDISNLVIKVEGPSVPNSIEEAIREIINQIKIDNSEEVIKALMEQARNLLFQLVTIEKNKFLDDLRKATSVDAKLQIIESFENRFAHYEELLTHPDKDVDNKIANYREEAITAIKSIYNEEKKNGEYTWQNYESIKASRDYIYNSFGNNEELKNQFNLMLQKMYSIIKNPNKEKHDEWQKEMQKFAEDNKLEPDKMTPYLTACAKMRNKKVSVTNEFEIKGLNYKKTRKKVTKVSKIKDFFKKHPKLKLIAIGLAILLGSQLGLAGLMMINTTAMSFLSAGPIYKILASINVALSKVVGGGLFQYSASGAYTFLGQPGALPLYTEAGAKLTTAALGLGGIGALVAKKIKKGQGIIHKPVIGPLTPEQQELFADCKEGAILDGAKGSGQLLYTEDAKDRQIKKAADYLFKRDMSNGCFVVNTKMARKRLNELEEEKEVEPIVPGNEGNGQGEGGQSESEIEQLRKDIEELKKIVKQQGEQIAKQDDMIKNSVEAMKKMGYTEEEAMQIVKNGSNPTNNNEPTKSI